jgi:CDP-diacylglycerol--glycerol-3-phosphate 3-phosphatidyltransferase
MDERRVSAFIKTTSLIKVLIMPLAIERISSDSPLGAVSVLAVIMGLALLERLREDLPSRAFAAMANRLALVPVLLFLAYREILHEPRFPILMVLGTLFIIAKEVLFILHGYNYLVKRHDYFPSRSLQKVSPLALLAVLVLYTLRWEPYNNIAMIAMITLSIIDLFGFLWNYYKRRRGIKDLNLATRITLLRLLVSPAFLIVYFYDRDPDFSDNRLPLQVLAVLLAVFFVVTDGLDGYFARKRNEVTKFGKYLDPFSDKICTMTIFLCFVASNYVPVWMVALIFYREAAVDVIRTLAAAENVVISARTSGKWKTALQGTAIITILMLATVVSELSRSVFPSLYPDFYADLLLIWSYVPFTLMALVTLVTLLSGLDYVLASQDILDKYFR